MSKNTDKTCLLKKIFCSMKSVTSDIAVTVFLSALKRVALCGLGVFVGLCLIPIHRVFLRLLSNSLLVR